MNQGYLVNVDLRQQSLSHSIALPIQWKVICLGPWSSFWRILRHAKSGRKDPQKAGQGLAACKGQSVVRFFRNIVVEKLTPLHEHENTATSIAYVDDIMVLIQDIETKTISVMKMLTIWCNRVKLKISALPTSDA